jgi:CubicO group peptidase (beta-lactamase class C family)
VPIEPATKLLGKIGEGTMNSRHVLRLLACGALLIAAAPSGRAEGTFDIPAGAHFNPQKLERVGDYLRDQVAQGKIPGAILLIQQHGKPVYHEFFGVRDVATKLPMSDDTIFRLFSMTKPITSVVAMMLIEEGKLRLDDPVAKYLPAFANVKVGVEKKADDGTTTLELVPPNRPPTILDLMRQTSGITYGFYGDSLVRKAYAKADIYAGDFDNAEFAERIAKLPLHDQPGTLWQYGHSTDILGRIMELVTGKSLLEIEKEKLLVPLGMTGTGFYVTDPEQKKLIAKPMPNDSNFRVGFESFPDVPMKWESGGGGMNSTLADLARFSQMVLNGGKLDGKQYLSPKTFELMTSDHVGAGSGVGRDYFYFPGDGFGFGLGFGVRTDPGNAKPPPAGSLGELKWDGASGCLFVIDRKQDMFFVLLEQTPSERQKIQPTVKRLIYEAMEN